MAVHEIFNFLPFSFYILVFVFSNITQFVNIFYIVLRLALKSNNLALSNPLPNFLLNSYLTKDKSIPNPAPTLFNVNYEEHEKPKWNV